MNLEKFYIHFRVDQDVNIAELIQNLKNSKIKKLYLLDDYSRENK
jgi:hypothetical protein